MFLAATLYGLEKTGSSEGYFGALISGGEWVHYFCLTKKLGCDII